MNLEEALLKTCDSATVRARWFLLITILCSSLMLVHLYLEQFGYQRAQLRSIQETLATSGCLRDAHSFDRLLDQAKDRKINEKEIVGTENGSIAGLYFDNLIWSNTLKDMKLQDRVLPLLALSVPANDFVPVMAFMLAMFVIGHWLCVRNMRAAIEMLDTLFPQRKFLATLNFTFTGLIEDGPFCNPVKIRVCSHLVPLICMSTSMVLDFLPIIEDIGTSGEPQFVMARLAIMTSAFLVILAFTLLTIGDSLAIDAVLHLQPEHQQIASLAHELWETSGRPDGCSMAHWQAAERVLAHSPKPGVWRRILSEIRDWVKQPLSSDSTVSSNRTD